MYAVIKTGGKQYKVSQGDVLRVEKLAAAEGETISFDQVLMIADAGDIKVGSPIIEGTTVTASVKQHGRAKKIEIIKFRRRKHHRKQMGHRQSYTEIEITAIGGKSAPKPAVKADAPAKAAAPKKKAPAKKAVAKKAPAKKKVVAKKAASKKKTSKKSESK
ncbi:MAG: 50S ribosomal protein L21 [Gammaproteobacteria bacterium]|nr:50S ribosomal protein L21 [Gammaproteobacteria bacterium]